MSLPTPSIRFSYNTPSVENGSAWRAKSAVVWQVCINSTSFCDRFCMKPFLLYSQRCSEMVAMINFMRYFLKYLRDQCPLMQRCSTRTGLQHANNRWATSTVSTWIILKELRDELLLRMWYVMGSNSFRFIKNLLCKLKNQEWA